MLRGGGANFIKRPPISYEKGGGANFKKRPPISYEKGAGGGGDNFMRAPIFYDNVFQGYYRLVENPQLVVFGVQKYQLEV